MDITELAAFMREGVRPLIIQERSRFNGARTYSGMIVELAWRLKQKDQFFDIHNFVEACWRE